MVLSKGEKVLVIVRRLFEKDLRRRFIGEITEATDSLIRVSGYAYIFDEGTKDYSRRDHLQTNIFSLIDAGIVIIVLPQEVNTEEIRYTVSDKGHKILTDGKSFKMRVSEFGPNI